MLVFPSLALRFKAGGCWNTVSGLHACAVSKLLTKSFLQPLQIFFLKIQFIAILYMCVFPCLSICVSYAYRGPHRLKRVPEPTELESHSGKPPNVGAGNHMILGKSSQCFHPRSHPQLSSRSTVSALSRGRLPFSSFCFYSVALHAPELIT